MCALCVCESWKLYLGWKIKTYTKKDALDGNKKYDMNCWNTNILFSFFSPRIFLLPNISIRTMMHCTFFFFYCALSNPRADIVLHAWCASFDYIIIYSYTLCKSYLSIIMLYATPLRKFPDVKTSPILSTRIRVMMNLFRVYTDHVDLKKYVVIQVSTKMDTYLNSDQFRISLNYINNKSNLNRCVLIY